MATVTDVEVANASFPTVRQDLNDILEAIATNFSADAEPTTTYPNQWWYETDTNKLYIRNEANDAWIHVLTLDQTTDVVSSVEGVSADAISEGNSSVEVVDTGTGYVQINVDGAEVARLDATGLGVGVTSPTAKLDVNGTIKLDGNYPVGTNNVALGNAALDDGSLSGANNTAVGANALTANTSGAENTALGKDALEATTTGSYCVAVGANAGAEGNNDSNTFVGFSAGRQVIGGSASTAIGRSAMEGSGAVVDGDNCTAVGFYSLYANSTGDNNTAVGSNSLQNTTTGGANTSIGLQSGQNNTTGGDNVFVGVNAGYNNTTAGFNTYVGGSSGFNMTTGQKNTIIGAYNGNQDGLDIRTSSNNIVLSDGDGVPRSRYESSLNRWTLEANASNNIAFALRNNATSQPYGIYLRFGGNAPDNTTQYFMECNDTSTARFRIYSDGDVVNHDNSYGAISDVKLKEQITDASSQWDDIKSLNIRKYKMKSDVAEKGDSDEHWRLGVIAQEVESAGMSGLIKTSPDMIENEDGELVESGEYTKQVKYSILYMKAVKALQEAMDRIETLEAKVDALENQ